MSRVLAAGALVWLLYALAWLLLFGPVLDESVLAGPVVAGDVVYPGGHPNAVVYRQAPLLLYQLAGLEWLASGDVWVVSVTHNLLFLFLSTFVPFAATAVCTRRPAWGHVAAALAASETACSFVGVYLSWIFPGFYSTGHVGIHVALLAVVLVAGGLERLGGTLAGLLPVVHASMTLVAWPALALWVAWARPARWRALLGGVGAGLAVAVALGAVIAWHTAGDAPSTPYEPGPDGAVVLRTYLATTDPHRQPFPVWSPIGLVGPVAFGVLAALALASRSAHRPAVVGVVLVGSVAWGWTLGTRAWQAVAGSLPPTVLTIMPGRFANLAMLLVIPLAVTALASARARVAASLAAGLLAVEIVLVSFARDAAFFELMRVILGVSVAGAAWGSTDRRWALGGLVLVGSALAPMGGLRAFAVAAALAFALAAFLERMPARGAPRPVLAVLCVAAALAALRGPHVPNAWDAGSERMSRDEEALAVWLHANEPRDAMLAVPLFPPTWLQPKTGHPVLVEATALANMPYFPRTASGIGRLVRDVFGIDYADPAAVDALRGPDGMLRPTSEAWTRAWESRDCDAWRALRARYGFRHVWTPRAHPVRLPVALRTTDWALHVVPDACAEGGATS